MLLSQNALIVGLLFAHGHRIALSSERRTQQLFWARRENHTKKSGWWTGATHTLEKASGGTIILTCNKE